MLAHLWLSLGYVGPSWGYVGQILALCCPILTLGWPILDVCWAILTLCSPQEHETQKLWKKHMENNGSGNHLGATLCLGPSWGLCWPMLGLCWPILGLFSWFCTFLPCSSRLLSALCFFLLSSFPLLACSAGLLSSFVCFFLFFLWLPPATCFPFLTFAACLLLPYPLWLSLAPCLLFICFFLFCLLFLQLACSCSLLFVLLLLLLLVPASALLASCLAAGWL